MFHPSSPAPPPVEQKNILIPYLVSLVFGLTMFIMLIVWFNQYQYGFAWTAFSIFENWNWHATLTMLGFSIFLGESILVFRTMKFTNKTRAKVAHFVMHVLGFVLTTAGLIAAFTAPTWFGFENFFSLHSWLGIITYVLFIVQFGCGVLTHIIPILPQFIRNYHNQCGILIYGLVILSITTGIMHRANLTGGMNYRLLGSEGMLINFMGLIFTIFSLLILYMAIHPQYK